MKSSKWFSYLLIIVSTFLFLSCAKDNVDYGSTAKEAIIKTPWSIDYYFSGQDKTDQFHNYKLSFAGNGTVTATDATSSFSGNWNMVTDVNRNDVLRINIQEAHFQDLNDQWTVLLTSDNTLSMKGTNSEVRLRKL